mgnify:CR=1 FL=1
MSGERLRAQDHSVSLHRLLQRAAWQPWRIFRPPVVTITKYYFSP